MQGTIQTAARQYEPGVILGDDGISYTYTVLGWRDAATPASPGMRVDFDTRGSHALAIYPVPGMAPPTPPLGGAYASPPPPAPSAPQPSAPPPQMYGAPPPQPPPAPAAPQPSAPPPQMYGAPPPPQQPSPFGAAPTAAPPPQTPPPRKLLGLKWQYWAIGGGVAAVVLVAVAAAFLFGLFSDDETETLPTDDEPTLRVPQATERPTPDAPFALDWEVSDSDIEAGESFTVTARMFGLQESGEHGGISVSFPSLTQSGGSTSSYSSSLADVEVAAYATGASNVAFHQPGATIYHREGNRQFPAEYLLVESDDATWPESAERTLVLRVTPKAAGDFKVQVRGWLCADGYTQCERVPTEGAVQDQQGWFAESETVNVASQPATAVSRIAFVSNRDMAGIDVYVMDEDGSNVVRLTQGSESELIFGPTWSPDGRRIAFWSIRDTSDRFDIYVMDADGSNIVRLTQGSGSEFNSMPTWSPDGRRIAFASSRDRGVGQWDIYAMDADGSNVVRLTHGSGDEVNTNPNWSPDGRRIAFTSDRDRGAEAADIYAMDADGSNVVRLTYGSRDEIDKQPNWSPDGRRIAFSSNRDTADAFNIYVMDADGSNIVRLTHGSGDEANDSPDWSPDGRRIAFASFRDRVAGVYVMDADGSHVVRLISGSGSELYGEPRWSPVSISPAPAAAPAQRESTATDPFSVAIETSTSSVNAGESFTVTARMYGLQESGEHGGISVSFPSLTQSGGSKDRHSSSLADIEVVDYTTGTSNVTFHQPGATIYHREGNRQFPAEYLLVESDDPTWPAAAERTLVLRVTPKIPGDFKVQVRGWLCADGYTQCDRVPTESAVQDQQGWFADEITISVAPPEVRATASASGRIAFSSGRDGDLEIYVMNDDGTDVVQLTHNDADEWHPALSPDGRRIAFKSDRDGEDYEIYVMNADGSGVVQLTDNDSEEEVPAWSPDGRRIAFSSNRDGDYEIYVMNADGSGVVQLTESGGGSSAWSPDGRRIAFDSWRDRSREIYVMNTDGSGLVRLTDNDFWDSDPAWSPDGRRIAFESDRDGDDDNNDYEIYVMNADGSGVVQLTYNDAIEWSATWSPDGRRIAFSSKRDGDLDIFIMNDDGTDVVQLTDHDSIDWSPTWSPAAEDVATAEPAFELAHEVSATEVAAGESFTLSVRMHGLQQAGEHGGISVSFPSLTQSGGSGSGYSSSLADVEVVDYTTGTSNVTFHQPGAMIYHREGNRQFPAEYLLVESDDATWPASAERTLVLKVTPKAAGDFKVQVRGWLCADGYTQCDRVPTEGAVQDQQGWFAATATVDVSVQTTAGPPFERNPALDFNDLGLGPNRGTAEGIWSDGEILWAIDLTDKAIYAFNLETQQRLPGKDFNVLVANGNTLPESLWSDGSTVWVADQGGTIFAYSATTMTAMPNQNFTGLTMAGNVGLEGIWSNGTTMWVADHDKSKLFAYDLTTKVRAPAHDFNSLDGAGNDTPTAIWSDGQTMWVSDWDDDKIYAYDMATKSRDPEKDFDTLGSAGNNSPEGLWSDGIIMWVRDARDDKLYAYNMPSAGSSISEDISTEGNLSAKASFQNFAVIDVKLDEYGDHDKECKARLGSDFRLADWNDLTGYYQSGGSLDALIDGLNWKDEKTVDLGVRHPRVTLDGEPRWDDGRRHFFVSRHDHDPPGYFLAHDDIDDYRLSLGSWYGESGEALCLTETI